MSTVSENTAEGESPADHDADVDPTRIDWAEFFEEWITNDKFNGGAETLGGYVAYYPTGVEDDEKGVALVKAALDAGLLKDTPEGIEPADPAPDEDNDQNTGVLVQSEATESANGAPDQNGGVLVDGDPADAPKEEVIRENTYLRQTISEMKERLSEVEQENEELRELAESNSEQIEDVEETANNAAETVDEAMAALDNLTPSIKTLRRGLVQTLSWGFDEGKTAGVDNVPLEKFRMMTDMELRVAGPNNQRVEAANPKNPGDGRGGGDYPFNPDELLEVERKRQAWKRKNASLEGQSGKDGPNSETRAVMLWHQIETVGEWVGPDNNTIHVSTGDARQYLENEGQLDPSRSRNSKNKSVRDAFSKLDQLAGEMFEKQRRGRSSGIEADGDTIAEAKKPLVEAVEGGSKAIYRDH